MACPSFHFPMPSMPREVEKRELFADYGIISGMCPIVKDGKDTELLFQKNRSLACPVLCAVGPLLPLLPPNSCQTTKEPCLSYLKESLEEVKQYTRVINHTGTRNTIQKLKNARVEIFGAGVQSRYRKTITNLAHTTAKYRENPYIPVVNTDYTGGCISALQHSGTKYLCFPTGPQLDTLSLYELRTDSRPELEHVTSWEHKRIYQVDTTVINNSCYIGVRSETSCRLLRLRDREEGIQFKRKMRLNFDSKPLSICMSPFIEGECVTLTAQGDLQLWDATGSAASQTGSVTQRFTDPAFWGHAAYSAHPRQLFVTDRTGVAVWDMRMSSRREDVFVLPSMQLRTYDRVTAGRPHPANPFYHLIATEETILMLDHRFPKLPVLQWWHTLAAPPQYINFAPSALPDRKEDVLLVSSQDHAETVCYQINMADPSLPPVSTTPPWRLAKPQDLYNLEGAPSLTEAVERRLAAPLVGVAAVNNSSEGGFCAIQVTSYGDVFGQRYVLGAADMEKTWCSGPGSSHLNLCGKDATIVREWHQRLIVLCPDKSTKSLEENQHKATKKAKDRKTASAAQESKKAETRLSYMPDRLQRLLPKKEPDMCCKLCGDTLCMNSLNSNTARISTSSKKEAPCPSCWWKNDRSTSIYTAAVSGKASPGTVDDETVDALLNWTSFESDPERFTSAKSQLLVKLWEGQDIQDLMEPREREQMLQEANIEMRRISIGEIYGQSAETAGNEANISDQENNNPSRNDPDPDLGEDEPDITFTQAQGDSELQGPSGYGIPMALSAKQSPWCQTSSDEPHPWNQILSNEPHSQSQLHDDTDDSDKSMELECPDLSRTTEPLSQTPSWKRPRETEEPHTHTEGSQSKRRRVHLSSESDNIGTPLTMFSQLYATPTSSKTFATSIGNSPAQATPSRTPKKKREGTKFKSVMGF